MGSILGGARAGIVASLWFAGSVSLFNALILLSFKNNVLAVLKADTTVNCASTTAAQGCFSTLLYPGIPLSDFVRTLIIGVFFALSIGIYFDYIPGRSYVSKTLLASFIMLIVLLFLGVFGIVASTVQELLMVSFELAAAVLYAVIFARLYRRATREVEFQSQRKGQLRIMVDKRDLTEKKRTLSVNSTHKIKAVSEGKPFKEWLVSGGVSVNDQRNPETTIKVVGDGLLKAA